MTNKKILELREKTIIQIETKFQTKALEFFSNVSCRKINIAKLKDDKEHLLPD